MNDLARAGITTVNYFFLRLVAERPNPQIIKDELQNYLMAFTHEHLEDQEIRTLIETEINEGSYFDDVSLEEAKSMLVVAMIDVLGDCPTPAYEFYSTCIEKVINEPKNDMKPFHLTLEWITRADVTIRSRTIEEAERIALSNDLPKGEYAKGTLEVVHGEEV